MPSGDEDEIAERFEACTFLIVPAAARPVPDFTT
jgi:hypothetical protein